jgi:hypothetical protein
MTQLGRMLRVEKVSCNFGLSNGTNGTNGTNVPEYPGV